MSMLLMIPRLPIARLHLHESIAFMSVKSGLAIIQRGAIRRAEESSVEGMLQNPSASQLMLPCSLLHGIQIFVQLLNAGKNFKGRDGLEDIKYFFYLGLQFHKNHPAG